MESRQQVKTWNVARELKGLPALASVAETKLGEVADVLIHPTEGKVIGLILQTVAGELCALAVADFEIEAGAVRLAASARLTTHNQSDVAADSVCALRDMVGALVITDRGNLLGRVSEVHISVATRRAFYRVVKSEWQRVLGGGFFMAGDVPRSYFHRNARLIVPTDTEVRYGKHSLAETA